YFHVCEERYQRCDGASERGGEEGRHLHHEIVRRRRFCQRRPAVRIERPTVISRETISLIYKSCEWFSITDRPTDEFAVSAVGQTRRGEANSSRASSRARAKSEDFCSAPKF